MVAVRLQWSPVNTAERAFPATPLTALWQVAAMQGDGMCSAREDGSCLFRNPAALLATRLHDGTKMAHILLACEWDQKYLISRQMQSEAAGSYSTDRGELLVLRATLVTESLGCKRG
jgi:hypothetical protein